MTFDDIIYATLDLLSVHMYIDWKVGRCVTNTVLVARTTLKWIISYARETRLVNLNLL